MEKIIGEVETELLLLFSLVAQLLLFEEDDDDDDDDEDDDDDDEDDELDVGDCGSCWLENCVFVGDLCILFAEYLAEVG